MNELSTAVIGLTVIVLCWAVVRINRKIDQSLSNLQSINDMHAVGESQKDLEPVSR